MWRPADNSPAGFVRGRAEHRARRRSGRQSQGEAPPTATSPPRPLVHPQQVTMRRAGFPACLSAAIRTRPERPAELPVQHRDPEPQPLDLPERLTETGWLRRGHGRAPSDGRHTPACSCTRTSGVPSTGQAADGTHTSGRTTRRICTTASGGHPQGRPAFPDERFPERLRQPQHLHARGDVPVALQQRQQPR